MTWFLTKSNTFPAQQLQMNEDAVSGIHFNVRGSTRGKGDRNSLGSNNSVSSFNQPPPSLTRVNSVTSVLKRLFSREDQNKQPNTPIPTQTDGG